MKKGKEILIEAIDSLFRYSSLEAQIKDGRLRYDAYLVISDEEFVIQIKPEISKGNKGIVLAELKNISRENNLPIILITKYIPSEIAREYVTEGINFLDVAGNCNIRHNTLTLLIEGKKIKRLLKANEARAFQEAGIRLIFQLLVDPEKVRLTYRELAGLANISLGSVATVMQELMDLNFILKTKQTKKLKNSKELLNRWTIAYHNVLKPRLLKKRMSFQNEESGISWQEIDLSQIGGIAFWGGEPGTTLFTGHLHPSLFTIYTNRNWKNFEIFGFAPDENGNIELLDVFWDLRTWQTVPPVLLFADLMSNGSDDNITAANWLIENELQYIK